LLEERFVGKRGSRCEYEHDRGDAPGVFEQTKGGDAEFTAKTRARHLKSLGLSSTPSSASPFEIALTLKSD